MDQTSLDLSSDSVPPTPVECLGLTFPSEDARREYFLGLLAAKLKDPAFRKIEGFPIGKDEDILALSDPPYYTACPNPWLGEFVQLYGTPYDPKKTYHREPFAADVSEGKNHPIYNAHSYHTKVPHRAIMRYILHYTEPGDLVFDGFCGTGMTGVAAQLCGDKDEVQALGYRVQDDGTILNEERKVFSKLGARRAVLNDLSPAATFIAYNYNTPVDVHAFEMEAKRILKEVEDELGWMYETKHTQGKEKGVINYVVWSDVNICPECAGEFFFWDEALDDKAGAVVNDIKCPHCTAQLSKRSFERKMETVYDKRLGRTISQGKQMPSMIDYSVGRKRFQKKPDENDLIILNRIAKQPFAAEVPSDELPYGNNTVQPKQSHGLTHIHHFYTERTLHSLTAYLARASKSEFRNTLTYVFTSAHQYTNRLCRLHVGNFFNRKGGTVDKPLTATLYMPSLSVETNAITRLGLRSRIREALISRARESALTTQSLHSLSAIPPQGVDYIFVDPPFGANIMYSEVNVLWEGWLKVITNNDAEAVHNEAQDKDFEHYGRLMRCCFAECYRLLKPGRWMTVEFSNTKASIWNLIQTALQESGFVVGNVSSIDKQKGSFKAMTTPTAVKQDLVISAYKPNGGLEERFAKHGERPEGAWDFVRTHLRNLPISKSKGEQLEFVAERDPRILYDRMVAFYVGHSTPVPLSSAEFQAELAEQFPERDGMFFLPEQVNEYDTKRTVMENIGQMSVFVEDERSAIDWLRSELKKKPRSFQNIIAEFMQQLNASWKKWEARPELGALLDQNFLRYDGEGEVPSQIHAYLSTNFSELRNLPKGDRQLRMKAKERWYVPDPKNLIQVEELRNKRLLEEFWNYLPEGYEVPEPPSGTAELPLVEKYVIKKIPRSKKLKEVRTEAVRVGFRHCYRQKDYQTILAVGEMLPESILHEDEQLQMLYDNAAMRAGVES